MRCPDIKIGNLIADPNKNSEQKIRAIFANQELPLHIANALTEIRAGIANVDLPQAMEQDTHSFQHSLTMRAAKSHQENQR